MTTEAAALEQLETLKMVTSLFCISKQEAEENTRKAVIDVLSRIEEALDADYWWDEPIQARELIEQLRREYQQLKATE